MPMEYKGQPVEHIQWNGTEVMDTGGLFTYNNDFLTKQFDNITFEFEFKLARHGDKNSTLFASTNNGKDRIIIAIDYDTKDLFFMWEASSKSIIVRSPFKIAANTIYKCAVKINPSKVVVNINGQDYSLNNTIGKFTFRNHMSLRAIDYNTSYYADFVGDLNYFKIKE